MDCEGAMERLEAWALGALDPHEQAAVDAHVTSCARCREAAAPLADTAALIPKALASAASVEAPASLKQRLLSAVESRRQTLAVATTDGPALAPPARASANAPQGGAQRRSWWRTPWAYGGAAAALLLALSLAWGAQSTVALFHERNLRSNLATLVGQQEVVLDVVDSSRTVRVLLRATDPSSTSYGKVYTRPDMPYVIAMTGRLPQAPAGQVYNLWVSSEGSERVVGKLTVNDQGFGLLVYSAPTNGPSFDSARVVLQPEGAVDPSGTQVLVWQKGTSRS